MHGGTGGSSDNGGAAFAPDRLRPEMASRKLQVLDFVRRYIERWGGSPSYGEIAAGCGTNRMRVKDAVHRLVRDGQLTRKPGPRGLGLPALPVTNPTLLAGPPLHYVAPSPAAEIDRGACDKGKG